ncbi:MAG TPA: RNA polymerase sigma factor [Candidatus Aquilonibacter sp.]|nr:RNA polymerase sigma factor [Candidatus Aquilonibacter sp.]
MIEGGERVLGEGILTAVPTVVQNRDAILNDLVREYARLVYRIAHSVLRNHQDAEDATQETFVRVWRYGNKIEFVENPKNWLARIAWRVALDRSKRREDRREIALEDRDTPALQIAAAGTPTDEALQSSEIAGRLEPLISALPAKLREPLILSTIVEMSPQEVAAALAISEAAVRSRVFRARQILRKKLTEQIRSKKECSNG